MCHAAPQLFVRRITKAILGRTMDIIEIVIDQEQLQLGPVVSLDMTQTKRIGDIYRPYTLGEVSDFFRLFSVIYNISERERFEASSKADLQKCISYLFNSSYWRQWTESKDIPRNIDELIDSYYQGILFQKKYFGRGPVIEGISLNSPLKLTLKGSLAALVVAVIICGGEIDLVNGKAKIPGLVSAISELAKVYIALSSKDAKTDGSVLTNGYINSLPGTPHNDEN